MVEGLLGSLDFRGHQVKGEGCAGAKSAAKEGSSRKIHGWRGAGRVPWDRGERCLVAAVVEVDFARDEGRAVVFGEGATDAGGVCHNHGGSGGEEVVLEDEVVSVWREGDGLLRTMFSELEDIVANNDGAVGAVFLVECEIEFGESSGLAVLVSDAAHARIWVIFLGVVDEQVARHYEVHGLINPSATTSISERVACHRDVCAAFFDADDAATVRAVDEVSGDGGVTTVFSEEESAHAAADDVVICKNDVLAALDVHGIAEGAELASGDAHVARGDDIERAFAGAASFWGVGCEVMRKHVACDASLTRTTAPDCRAVWRVGDADEIGSGLRDKVLPAANEFRG